MRLVLISRQFAVFGRARNGSMPNRTPGHQMKQEQQPFRHCPGVFSQAIGLFTTCRHKRFHKAHFEAYNQSRCAGSARDRIVSSDSGV